MLTQINLNNRFLLKILFCLLFTSLVALISSSENSALASGSICKMYDMASLPDVPSAVAKRMSIENLQSSYACTTAVGDITVYAPVSPPSSIGEGVCEVIADSRKEQAIGQIEVPSKIAVFMAISDTECPRPAGSNYILADEISEGLFKYILNFIDISFNSKESFLKNVVTSYKNESGKNNIDKITGAYFGPGKIRPRVIAISFGNFIVPQQRNRYVVALSNPNNEFQSWQVVVDITSVGIRIFDCESLIVN